MEVTQSITSGLYDRNLYTIPIAKEWQTVDAQIWYQNTPQTETEKRKVLPVMEITQRPCTEEKGLTEGYQTEIYAEKQKLTSKCKLLRSCILVFTYFQYVLTQYRNN